MDSNTLLQYGEYCAHRADSYSRKQRKEQLNARAAWDKYEVFDMLSDRDNAEKAEGEYYTAQTNADNFGDLVDIYTELSEYLEKAGELWQTLILQGKEEDIK